MVSKLAAQIANGEPVLARSYRKPRSAMASMMIATDISMNPFPNRAKPAKQVNPVYVRQAIITV
jgi:hypothetical protein